MDTKLFIRQQPGGFFAAVDREEFPSGTIWWVGSAVTGASDSEGFGRNPDAPFATLDYAIGMCTANVGDTILVLPGHSETYTTGGAKVILDKPGVRIVGLGPGASRPTFTYSHVNATWTWSAEGCSIENLLHVTGIDAVVTYGTISAANAVIKNCEGRDTTDVEVINDWTCTGDRLAVDGYFKNGFTGGNANVAVFTLAGVDRAEIKNCRFITKVTTAVINFTNDNTAIEVHDCDFLVTSTTNYSKNIVASGGTTTWSAYNLFDLGAGAAFSGGSGSALASGDVSALAVAVGVIDEFHDVPAANAVLNAQINEVIGNKADTAGSGAVTDTSSLVKYAKQLVSGMIVIDEFHDVPAQNAILNAQINEVIGNKTDTAGSGAVTDTSSLVKYIKQIVTDVEAAAVSLATNAAWSVRTIKKTGLVLDNGDVADVFTIAGGPIELLGFNMLITTAVSANACAVHFQLDPTLADYADTPLCGAADINAAAVGNVFSIIDCDSAQVWVKNADGTNVGRMMEIGSQFLVEGGIDYKAVNADPSTGVADVYLTYRPLSATSTVS